jgi:thioredoxin-dependent peroxiredoxin
VGVSADQVDRQNEFDRENDFNFPLLSDPDKEVASRFGVKRLGFLPNKRATFVIGTDRVVIAVVTSETSMNAHADRALVALRASAN